MLWAQNKNPAHIRGIMVLLHAERSFANPRVGDGAILEYDELSHVVFLRVVFRHIIRETQNVAVVIVDSSAPDVAVAKLRMPFEPESYAKHAEARRREFIARTIGVSDGPRGDVVHPILIHERVYGHCITFRIIHFSMPQEQGAADSHAIFLNICKDSGEIRIALQAVCFGLFFLVNGMNGDGDIRESELFPEREPGFTKILIRKENAIREEIHIRKIRPFACTRLIYAESVRNSLRVAGRFAA